MKHLILAVLMSFSVLPVWSVDGSKNDELKMKPAFLHDDDLIITGGQPSRSDIKKLGKMDVKLIINLRMPQEFDQKKLKLSSMHARIKHMSMPVRGIAGITIENTRLLHDILDRNQGKKTLIHCASGNRAGALLALREYFIKGKSQEEALAFGKKHGMTGFGAVVKNMIRKDKITKEMPKK